MTGNPIIVAGIEIPSSDPIFLTAVAVHVLLGLACTITGIVAMLSVKRPGRHPLFGSIYYWCQHSKVAECWPSGMASV